LFDQRQGDDLGLCRSDYRGWLSRRWREFARRKCCENGLIPRPGHFRNHAKPQESQEKEKYMQADLPGMSHRRIEAASSKSHQA
jgi:hypothetical protein